MKYLRVVVGGALLLLASVSAHGQGFSITISVDENCNGQFSNTSGFQQALPCTVTSDPGPGGLPNVLMYDTLNPPGLTPGDLILLDPVSASISDIIRFNPTSFINGNTGSIAFYSDNLDGLSSLADVGFPGAFYANTLTVTELGIEGVDTGFTYTPTAGQPGFVSGAGGPVTYVINSDAVPEPASIGLMICGMGALIGRKYLRRTA